MSFTPPSLPNLNTFYQKIVFNTIMVSQENIIFYQNISMKTKSVLMKPKFNLRCGLCEFSQKIRGEKRRKGERNFLIQFCQSCLHSSVSFLALMFPFEREGEREKSTLMLPSLLWCCILIREGKFEKKEKRLIGFVLNINEILPSKQSLLGMSLFKKKAQIESNIASQKWMCTVASMQQACILFCLIERQVNLD